MRVAEGTVGLVTAGFTNPFQAGVDTPSEAFNAQPLDRASVDVRAGPNDMRGASDDNSPITRRRHHRYQREALAGEAVVQQLVQ